MGMESKAVLQTKVGIEEMDENTTKVLTVQKKKYDRIGLGSIGYAP